ncbi:MAG: TonB family protein [Alishewanella aestuarii]
MLKRFAFLLLCCSFTLRADWSQAILAYEQQDYSTAQLHFTELVKVGNANAMFSLAAMHFNGEGQDADKVQAAALFKLAAAFGHADAAALAAQLNTTFQPAEHADYAQILQQWQQQVMVPAEPAMLTRQSVATDAHPIRRVEPRYPVEAARRGQSGYVKMHYRVDEQGRVSDITVLDAYPEKIFVREAMKALQSWRYSPGSPQLTVT